MMLVEQLVVTHGSNDEMIVITMKKETVTAKIIR